MKRRLNLALFVVFALLIGVHLVYVLRQADRADQSEQGKIYTIYDDPSYQIPAINMLHGLGFWWSVNLPLDDYHFALMGGWQSVLLESAKHPNTISYAFFRAPGFPLMLTASYALFGDSVLTARRMLAVLTWATALLLLIIGAYTAGWIGSLAGGLIGLYTVRFQPDLINYNRIMTEIPAAFWLTLFMLCFVVYLRSKRIRFLVLSAITFAALLFIRSVFVFALPFFLIYLFYTHHSFKRILLFVVIVALPVGAWSAYVSSAMHTFVPMTTQGGAVFPEYNNLDVLEGNYIGAGNWNPGEQLTSEGTVSYDSHNSAHPPENPWVKGLTFWAQHIPQLPELFYLKLRAGFWYSSGRSENEYQMERLQLFGIGVLLFMMGFRLPRRKNPLYRLSASTVVVIQLGLLATLLIASDRIGLFVILLAWGAIFLLALLRPYGEVYQLKAPELAAFLGFVGYHATITLLFGGDGNNRFQHPLDPMLMLCALIGAFTITVEVARRLYKAVRHPKMLPWAVIAAFVVVNLALLEAAYIYPNTLTEQWMADHVPQHARVIMDWTSVYDVFPATLKQNWNWKITTVSIAQNNTDIDPLQDTYFFVDERASFGASFKTRVDTLVQRGAVLLYESENPFDIGLRQAVLVQPASQMIIRSLNTKPLHSDG